MISPPCPSSSPSPPPPLWSPGPPCPCWHLATVCGSRSMTGRPVTSRLCTPPEDKHTTRANTNTHRKGGGKKRKEKKKKKIQKKRSIKCRTFFSFHSSPLSRSWKNNKKRKKLDIHARAVSCKRHSASISNRCGNFINFSPISFFVRGQNETTNTRKPPQQIFRSPLPILSFFPDRHDTITNRMEKERKKQRNRDARARTPPSRIYIFLRNFCCCC